MDPTASAPYLRVANALRDRIESGELRPGDRLPSNTALMAEFGVASHTAQRAIRHLKAAGLVETVFAKGVYVRERRKRTSRSASYLAPPPDGEKARYGGKSDIIGLGEVEPPDDVAEALGLGIGETAFLRRRTITVDGEVVEIVNSYYPVDLARGTALTRPGKLRGGSPAELKRLGVDQHHCVELVDARMPSEEEVRLLGLWPMVPVFRILRTVLTAEDRPVEVLDMVLGSDRYQLRYELPIHG